MTDTKGIAEHNPRGFLDHDRITLTYQPPEERIGHWGEFTQPLAETTLHVQASRCMDCGIPYCHGDGKETGCPTNNQIPDFNALVRAGDWRIALQDLHGTNNFPEFTGRTCPAPCEASCVLNLENQPVTIKSIESAIIDKGWAEGWVVAEPPPLLTGKKVAIVGAGPAGMACAQQLRRAGHEVTVFEKNRKAGGLLRYGIPDFKLEKHTVDRRQAQMVAEGVKFEFGVEVGVTLAPETLMRDYDAVVLAAGAEVPRDMKLPGRELGGIHYAMDYLTQQNRRLAGEAYAGADILATDKDVVVIGGGDTGADCIGTARRQGARSITQITHGDQPAEVIDILTTWPYWPNTLQVSTSHKEGAMVRDFGVVTQGFAGEQGRVTGLECVRAVNRSVVADSAFRINADLVLLAIGFANPVQEGLIRQLGVACDGRKNVLAAPDSYRTSVPKVFAGGDMRRGASLVVWAIREGRGMAQEVDRFLMGKHASLGETAHSCVRAEALRARQPAWPDLAK